MPERDSRPETVEVKKRRLRTALRQARLDAGMTQKAAADALVWSISKIVRIEQGTVPVAPSDVRVMMQLYGKTDPIGSPELVDLLNRLGGTTGWSTFSDSLPRVARTVRQRARSQGDLQVRAIRYPWHVSNTRVRTRSSACPGNSEEQVERRLEVRTQRQQLLESPIRPELDFILGETALIRTVGDEGIMREQITHVMDLAKLDGISVLVLPFAAGAHRGMGGAFTVLQFDDPPLSDLLYLENAERESVSRDEEGEIRRYLELFVELQNMASKHGSLEDHAKRAWRAFR